jgi:hypothetical protein
MPLRVTVMGSCRVWTPFRMLADDGRLELRNAGVYGFVHYAKEVVQQLEVMSGGRRVPARLAPYISHKAQPAGADEWVDIPTNDLSETDLLVVEISSLKEIVFEGYYLQINRVRDKLVSDNPKLMEWWRNLYDEREGPDRRFYLTEVDRSTERNIVVFTKVTIQDQPSMYADMRTIVGFYDGPILFVSHFNTPTFGGHRLEIRDRLVRFVEENAEGLGKQFFNPAALVEAFGLRSALQDLAHYTPEFERAIAECYWARYCAPLAAQVEPGDQAEPEAVEAVESVPAGEVGSR